MTQFRPKPPSRDEYEEWLASQWVWLEPFCEELKKEGLPSKADLLSINALEGYLLRKFETVDDIMKGDNGPEYLNKFAIFIGTAICNSYPMGEVKWRLVDDDPKDAFYGLPVVVLPTGEPICPQSLVTAALDRRTGRYISSAIKGSMGS